MFSIATHETNFCYLQTLRALWTPTNRNCPLSFNYSCWIFCRPSLFCTEWGYILFSKRPCHSIFALMDDSLEINSSPNSAKRGTFQCSIRHIIHVSLFFTSFVTHRLLSQQTLIVERYVRGFFVVEVKTQLHIRSSKNLSIITNLPILWPPQKGLNVLCNGSISSA